jgi:catechol 2,3-dioxygenase-like lactoylglutathione lyase family enzyme
VTDCLCVPVFWSTEFNRVARVCLFGFSFFALVYTPLRSPTLSTPTRTCYTHLGTLIMMIHRPKTTSIQHRVQTADVYAVSEELLAAGVRFQKKPDEGNMKGLAFALDPDGYWVEIVKRADSCKLTSKYNISQTMIRVANAEASLAFYRDHLGMKVICEKHFPQWEFSLYFLSSEDEGPADTKSEEAFEFMKVSGSGSVGVWV